MRQCTLGNMLGLTLNSWLGRTIATGLLVAGSAFTAFARPLSGFMLDPFPMSGYDNDVRFYNDFQIARYDWGARLVRIPLYHDINMTWDRGGNGRVLQPGDIDQIRACLDTCSAVGLKAIIDLHNPPSNVWGNGGINTLFQDAADKQGFKDSLKLLFDSFRSHSALYGIDLLNEPYYPSVTTYRNLLKSIFAQADRSNFTKKLILEPSHGNPDLLKSSFLTNGFEAKIPSNAVFSVHIYPSDRYNGGTWSGSAEKNRLLSRLDRVSSFVRAYEGATGRKAPMYIGEFSVKQSVSDRGAVNWIKEAVRRFESEGWMWTYHALGQQEDSVWSPYGGNREKYLKQALAGNP